MSMNFLILGAGRMGYGAVFDLLNNSKDVESVTVIDSDPVSIESIGLAIDDARLKTLVLDISNTDELSNIFQQNDSVISCVNYWHNLDLSKLAIQSGANFCDLGGNNSIVDRQLKLDKEAKEAGINIIPDCGLAPGMVSLLAIDGANRFDQIKSIKIRVGGLPQAPKPPLEYQLVFSVEGLINEYVEKARVIRDGKILEIDSMTECEPISFDNFPKLEAFQTSGGTSTLPETLLGKIETLDYKTIRYAGHCEKFKTMIDLGLCKDDPIRINSAYIKPRQMLGHLLIENLAADEPDYVLIRLDFEGVIENRLEKLRFDIVDEFDTQTKLSAMMRTTAFPASIIAQMMAKGDVKMRGATPQEKAIDPPKFIEELTARNIDLQIT